MQAILTRSGDTPVIDKGDRDIENASRAGLREMLREMAERLVASCRDIPPESFHYPPY